MGFSEKFTVTINRDLLSAFDLMCQRGGTNRNFTIVRLISNFIDSNMGSSMGSNTDLIDGTHSMDSPESLNKTSVFQGSDKDMDKNGLESPQATIQKGKLLEKTEQQSPMDIQKGPIWQYWDRARFDEKLSNDFKTHGKLLQEIEDLLCYPPVRKVLDHWWKTLTPGATTVTTRPITHHDLQMIRCILRVFKRNNYMFPEYTPIATNRGTINKIIFPSGLDRQNSNIAAENFINDVSQQLDAPYDLVVDQKLQDSCRSRFLKSAMKSDDWFRTGNKKNWSWLGESKSEAQAAYRERLARA